MAKLGVKPAKKHILCVILVLLQLCLSFPLASLMLNSRVIIDQSVVGAGGNNKNPVILDFYNSDSKYYIHDASGSVGINPALLSYATKGGSRLFAVDYEPQARALRVIYENTDQTCLDPRLNIALTEGINKNELPYVRVKMRLADRTLASMPTSNRPDEIYLTQIYFKQDDEYLYQLGSDTNSHPNEVFWQDYQDGLENASYYSYAGDGLVVNDLKYDNSVAEPTSRPGVCFDLNSSVVSKMSDKDGIINRIAFDGVGLYRDNNGRSDAVAVDGLELLVEYIGFFENEAQANAWDRVYAQERTGQVFDFTKQPTRTYGSGTASIPENDILTADDMSHIVSDVTNSNYYSGWSALSAVNSSNCLLQYVNPIESRCGYMNYLVPEDLTDPSFTLDLNRLDISRYKWMRVHFVTTPETQLPAPYNGTGNWNFFFSKTGRGQAGMLTNRYTAAAMTALPADRAYHISRFNAQNATVYSPNEYIMYVRLDDVSQYLESDEFGLHLSNLRTTVAGETRLIADTLRFDFIDGISPAGVYGIYDIGFFETREAASNFSLTENTASYGAYRIDVLDEPTKKVYPMTSGSASADLTGTKIRVFSIDADGVPSYEDITYGSGEFIASNVAVTGFGCATVGPKTVTVTFRGMSFTYDIFVYDSSDTRHLAANYDFRSGGNITSQLHPDSNITGDVNITTELPSPYGTYTNALYKGRMYESYYDWNFSISGFDKNELGIEAYLYIPSASTKVNIIRSAGADGITSGFSLSVENGLVTFAANSYSPNNRLYYKLDPLELGDWVHIFAVSDGNNGAIYVNKRLASYISGMGIAHGAYGVEIGSSSDDPANNAYIGYVRLYNDIPAMYSGSAVSRTNTDAMAAELYSHRDPVATSFAVTLTEDPVTGASNVYYGIYGKAITVSDLGSVSLTVNYPTPNASVTAWTQSEQSAFTTDKVKDANLVVSGYNAEDTTGALQSVNVGFYSPWASYPGGAVLNATFNARVRYIDRVVNSAGNELNPSDVIRSYKGHTGASDGGIQVHYNTTASDEFHPVGTFTDTSGAGGGDVTRYTYDEVTDLISSDTAQQEIYIQDTHGYTFKVGDEYGIKYRKFVNTTYVYYGTYLTVAVNNGGNTVRVDVTYPAPDTGTDLLYVPAGSALSQLYPVGSKVKITASGNFDCFTVNGKDNSAPATHFDRVVAKGKETGGQYVYEFTLGTSTVISCIYGDANGQLLDRSNEMVTDGALASEDREKQSGIIGKYVSYYVSTLRTVTVPLGNSHASVSAPGGTVNGNTATVVYDSVVTVSALKYVGDTVFEGWYTDPTLTHKVSSSNIYTFNVSGDVTLYHKYIPSDNYTANPDGYYPCVDLTAVKKKNGNTVVGAVYTVTRSVPEPYELIESGVLISASAAPLNEITTLDKLDDTATTVSNLYTTVRKLTATGADADGTFKVHVSAAFASYYGRGYLVVKDKAGNVSLVLSPTTARPNN